MSDAVLDAGPEVTTDTAICACGATMRHGTCGERCERGHLLAGNQARRTHGAYSFRDRGESALPPEVRLTVEEFKQGVLSDRGGRDELSTIQQATIGHFTECETLLRLLANDLAARGVLTAKGRVRSTYSKWLETLDRWERLASKIGVDRRARALPTLADYLRQATPADQKGEEPQ